MVARIAARTSVLLAAASLSLPSPALAAKEPLALAPSSAWVMSYDAESCRLARSFGTGDQLVVAHFIKFQPGTGITIAFAGKMLAPSAFASTLRAYFAPGDTPEKYDLALIGEGPAGFNWQFSTGLIPRKELRSSDDARPEDWHAKRERERAAEIRRFVVADGPKQPVALETGSLAEPMAAMDTCLDDLVTSWGFDPQVQRTLQRNARPTNNPRAWVTPDDYPGTALRNAQSGRVSFRLGISAEGAVTTCTIQSENSHPAFNTAACDAVKRRARFDPAVDAAGKPVASYWVNTVTFVTPRQ